MNHISLFSGIGGFDLAAEWMGWNNVAHCEWNPFGQRVLNYYWPNAISYHDITKTDFTIHRGTIDIVTGGFPCQPYSVAGKRKGKEDERHLWPEMLRAIREIQPRWVVGENVGGLLSWNGGLVFNEVQADLEAEGYEVLPFLLPAAGVNAPHKRDRIWFVAYAHDKRGSSGLGEVSEENGEISEWNEDAKPCNTGVARAITDTTSINRGKDIFPEDVLGGREICKHECERSKIWSTIRPVSKCGASTNPNSRRQSGEEYRKEKSGFFTKESIPDNWQNFPTQSPVCNGNDGISSRLDIVTILETIGRKVNKKFKAWNWWRNESIKAGGNAIVPKVALQIFKAIEQYENQKS